MITNNGDPIPVEIIHHILSILEAQQDVNSLLGLQGASVGFHHIVSSYLYRNVILSEGSFHKFFNQYFLIHEDGRITLPADYNCSDHLSISSNYHDMEPLIKISSVLRIRVLFSFVKKITIYPDKDCGNPKGRNNFASFHLYDWLDHLNYIPLPNLESLCLCGTRSKPYYPSLATGLLNLLCKPKSLCCKWLDPVYELGNLISLAWDHSLEKIIIHGADQMHFPPTGNYSVRFSIVLHGNENILENAFRILGSLDHPHLKDTFGPWRIVGGDGLILESSRDVNEMVDYMCQIGEDRSERSSSSSEESDANEKVDDRGKMMVFLDKLSATKRGEEESEPPCEVCGESIASW